MHRNADNSLTRPYVAWLWLLSGAPVGLALILLPPAGRLILFTLFVLLETGHSLSPVVLAWTHREFRMRIIYPQPLKFMLLPGLIASTALAIGIVTQAGWTSYDPRPGASALITGWDNPFPLLVWFYSAWNLYHFAMQDFGVLVLLTGSANRVVKRVGCLIALVGSYLAIGGLNFLGLWHTPGLAQSVWWLGPLVMTGMVSVNHWVVDIGLSTRVMGRWFLVGILAAGAIGFTWMVPTSHGMMIRIIPAIVCARLALGFVHFLYSRWVWQLGDPRVRVTIGKELLA